jgi:hypothetical protein
MSIAAMTTLAVARRGGEHAPPRAPRKRDVGERTGESAHADETASTTKIMTSSLPTGLVTIYTSFIAVVSKSVANPTHKHPHPHQHGLLRWIGFVVMVVLAITMTIQSYRKKSRRKDIPLLEVTAVAVVAAAWGLGLPDSPLLVMIHHKTTGILTSALIALIGGGVSLLIANNLKKPAS